MARRDYTPEQLEALAETHAAHAAELLAAAAELRKAEAAVVRAMSKAVEVEPGSDLEREIAAHEKSLARSRETVLVKRDMPTEIPQNSPGRGPQATYKNHRLYKALAARRLSLAAWCRSHDLSYKAMTGRLAGRIGWTQDAADEVRRAMPDVKFTAEDFPERPKITRSKA